MDKTFRFLLRSFIICYGCIAAWMLILTGYEIFCLGDKRSLYAGFAAGMLAMALIVILCIKIRWNNFGVCVFIGAVILKLAVVLAVQPPIESDFLVMYQAGQKFADGDFSFSQTPYFSLWAYQTVFVIWQGMLLKLCGSVFFIKLVNIALSTAGAYLVYRLLREHTGKKCALAAVGLMTVSPFGLTLHCVLSNQIPAAFFMILGLYFILSRDIHRLGTARYVLAGLFIQMGNLLRPEGLIILVAFLAFVLFSALQKRQRLAAAVFAAALVLISYFALSFAAESAVKAAGINPNGIQNGNPEWKFVTGLNRDTLGTYCEADWMKIYATLDDKYQATVETKTLQRELIRARLNMPKAEFAGFMSEKVRMQWARDALHWALKNLQEKPMYALQGADRGIFFGSLLLSAFGLLSMWPGRDKSISVRCIYYFVVFAAFWAFLLVEVQPRYAYLPHIFIFMGAGFGIYDLMHKWIKKGC